MMFSTRPRATFRKSSYPRPEAAENISASSRPIRVRPKHRRMPAARDGSTLGTTIRRRSDARDMPRLAESLRCSRLTPAVASTMIRNIGRTPETKANEPRLRSPIPRKSRKIGYRMIFGTLLKAYTSGSAARDQKALRPRSMPATPPIRIAAA